MSQVCPVDQKFNIPRGHPQGVAHRGMSNDTGTIMGTYNCRQVAENLGVNMIM